ncbi:DoxX family protein [Mucilaginibacter sp. AK015]|uniref:DoxX family protein n=1 Tax=Mucilaginibacter sp. AK015 TaxID=2723072 RepID=UPI00161C56B6|nr:DoxX family protein [Mucilaginibacter sp. AK015]MBB5397919.1 putative membrane protein [Mucilaginibacter sp. AK015]
MKKRNLIVYWITTALVAIGMFGSGMAQIMQTKQMTNLIAPLGYPAYFLYIIGTWKVLGAITIAAPRLPLVKEWAYAGLFFVMTGAFMSHLLSGDYNIKALAGPLFQTVFIILSWYFRPASRKLVSIN